MCAHACSADAGVHDAGGIDKDDGIARAAIVHRRAVHRPGGIAARLRGRKAKQIDGGGMIERVQPGFLPARPNDVGRLRGARDASNSFDDRLTAPVGEEGTDGVGHLV